MSWQYFPKRVWLSVENDDGTDAITPNLEAFSSSDARDAHVRAWIDARPDGSFPDFPDGAVFEISSLEAVSDGSFDFSSYNINHWGDTDLSSLSWEWHHGVSGFYKSNVIRTFPVYGSGGPRVSGSAYTFAIFITSSTPAADQVSLTNGWSQHPRGFSPAYAGSMSSPYRKGVEITGIHADFENTGTWYHSCTITDSSDSAYVVGSSFDPLSRPNGYALTAQTETTRTWSKSDTDHFTITLSDVWVYDSTAFDGKSLDCGSFVMTGPQSQGIGGITTFANSVLGYLEGASSSSGWPSSIGTQTFLVWSPSSGYTQQTFGYNTLAPYYPPDPTGYTPFWVPSWSMDAPPSDVFLINAISASGMIAEGLITGTTDLGGGSHIPDALAYGYGGWIFNSAIGRDAYGNPGGTIRIPALTA